MHCTHEAGVAHWGAPASSSGAAARDAGAVWGLCSMRSAVPALDWSLIVLMLLFAPRGERGEEDVPKVRTTSVRQGGNQLLRVRWSAFWDNAGGDCSRASR